MSHHLVEIRQLRHVYPDGTVALRDVSLRIHHGEAVAIIGANGAGKSTLLLHLNGVLAATAGEIRIGERAVTKATLPMIRRTVGMVFEDPDDQLFMPTVYDDVAFGLHSLQLSPVELERRVDRALAWVDAGSLRGKPAYHLSVGEKKRVAIASVLAMRPDILVLDEPTSGLDPRSRRQLIGLLRGFHHTRIITSHDLDMVAELCERTIVLHEGEIKADGPSLEIFRDQALLSACHLEPPLAMQGCPVCAPAGPGLLPVGHPPLVAPHGDGHHDHEQPSSRPIKTCFT
jgi:cobalt/nickel transport system ATP-binding protein